MGKGRPLLYALALSVLVCSVFAQSFASHDDPPEDPAEPPDPHFFNSVWVGGSFGLGRFVESTGLFEAHDPTAGDVHALSIDEYRGRVWAFAQGRLQIRDFSGALLKEIAIPVPAGLADGIVSPDETVRDKTLEDALCLAESIGLKDVPRQALWPLANLATNYTDGQTWLSLGDQIYQYDVDGELLGTQTNTGLITGLAVDPKRSRWWVGTCDAITLYDNASAALAKRSYIRFPDYVKNLHFDRRFDRLWAAGEEYLMALDPDGKALLDKHVNTFLFSSADFVTGSGNGNVWLGAGEQIRRFNSNGTQITYLVLFQGLIPVPGQVMAPPVDVVDMDANLADHSIWVANRQTLVHVGDNGQILNRIPLQNLVPAAAQPIGLPAPLLQPVLGPQNRIRPIAVYTDLLAPELEILCPDEGATVANRFDNGDPARPIPFRVVVAYREAGVGIDNATLDFSINGKRSQCRPLDSRPACDFDVLDDPPDENPSDDGGEGLDRASLPSAGLLPSSILSPKEGKYVCEVTVEDDDQGAYEGAVALTVAAKDYKGNQSATASRHYTLDNYPPEIIIESPPQGSEVNTRDVTLSGYVSEPAALEINGAAVALDVENRFSHPLSFPAEGENYVVLRATDRAGRETIYSAYYWVDTLPPAKPDEGKIQFVHRDGDIEVIGAAGSVEPDSLVTITNLRTGESVSVYADYNDGSFTAQIAGQVGDHLRIVASDYATNQSEAYEKAVPEPLFIKLTYPRSDMSVEAGYVLVSGEVIAGADTGITVNGELAVVIRETQDPREDDRFYARILIEPDTTEVVARITNRAGRSITTTVPIAVSGQRAYDVQAIPFSGVAPANISFQVEDNQGHGISEIRADFDNDGAIDLITNDPDEPLEFTYTNQGLNVARIYILDASGGGDVVFVTVVITDPVQEDAVIQALWQGMKDALMAGNAEGALSLFQPASRPVYGEIFSALQEYMPEVLDDFSGIYAMDLSSDGAEYAVVIVDHNQSRVHVVTFTRTSDGLWAIDSM